MSEKKIEASAELYVKSALFYLVLFTFTLVWTSMGMIIAPALPYRRRFNFIIGNYTRFVIHWLRLCCNVSYQVIGTENIPKEPCIIYSKHQSTWETFFLQTLFSPQAPVIKKELLSIPFFGWCFSLLAPIAIDRSKKREAMAQIISQGQERLEDNIWVLIFPEGTRVNPGERKPFSKGAARLSVTTGKPILPVAHNSGDHWPNQQFLKYPGQIKVVIGAAISPEGKTIETLNAEGEQWVNSTTQAIHVNSREQDYFGQLT
ncbi:MAG: 1-acyl-sn-glycerol-3-phosphate acyltransferase [Hahellaceae bacterium]|nr:1-acyl-sn-glycerol-3-phosphate acyltransferase [Hahellaceae bacterium]